MKNYKVGDKVNLTLKLYDSNESLFVRAKVFDKNFSLFGTFGLIHVISGLYRYELNGLLAGNYYVIYEIYKDSGYNNKDNKYSEAEESFSVETNLEDYIANKVDEQDGRAI